ncbi:protein ACCELERATED CELL DEATH 6 isoform X3 [Lactuca sativa]|uniref:protein ACCELERATED CELL DEATH 6 isoform X3 n=1 Tax=Lactuca sativa TaxID=4236 RepID=UPI001C68D35F|nr:protein ACCELERATED CELL DEATH 6 isoform X3 [Lactuca sativa]XP_042752573.1 protein ACCELERATED CELL DEATH 6 isoform X3 [Lactuca sativa]
MADNMTPTDYRKINASLYDALSEGDDNKVCHICKTLPDGPLRKLTIHDDTVLHIASYHKRNKLVLQLLGMLPEDQPNILTVKNEAGKTILHSTATNNDTVEAAVEMLRRAPSLLAMTDNLGETPLFRAARYGKSKIFYFLQAEMNRRFPAKATDLMDFLQRNNKATILHVAIHTLALDIAKTYPRLIGEEDGDGMTALQLLACKPSVFNNGFEANFFKRFICKIIYLINPKERASRVPILKKFKKQKLKSESAKELATLLIENDTSWEESEPMPNQNRTKLHKYGGDIMPSQNHSLEIIIAPTPDSPLILATKSGCTEIVKKILQMYPQAVEHIDKDGRDILHVAIQYRRKEIYNLVVNMKYSLRRLRGKIDKQGNSIMHMVGIKVKDPKAEQDNRSPAFVLRDDLLLFSRVKDICTIQATLQVNEGGVTAEQLFIESNARLQVDAKEWMKSTAEHCSIVAVLIATVAFAAAYTVPGGPNQNTGYPLLKSKPFFIVFALADALSLACSLTSVIIFLSILTSSFRLNDFQHSLHNKLFIGLTVLILSVSMMMIAFAATLILTISSEQGHWKNIMLYMISFFPVTVFVCSYIHLYKLLIEAFLRRLKKAIAAILPTPDVDSPQAMHHHIQPSQATNTSSFV